MSDTRDERTFHANVLSYIARRSKKITIITTLLAIIIIVTIVVIIVIITDVIIVIIIIDRINLALAESRTSTRSTKENT